VSSIEVRLQCPAGHYCAVPVRVDVCVPTASVTDTVALWPPIGWVVSGRNCTVTTQAVPGARLVWPINWPLPAGPQVDANRTMLNSVGLVPPSVACAIPVSVAFPVLVSVNTCVGAVSAPTPLVALPKLCDVGVRAAVTAAARPVPLRRDR